MNRSVGGERMMITRAALAAVLALSFLVLPRSVAAQEPGKVSRVGVLAPRTRADGAPFVDAFRRALRELGWVEGKNVVIEDRYADGRSDCVPELAAELVRLNVDVILASNTQTAVAAKNATSTTPIVMVTGGDPVGLGLVASLARPGANVTGLSYSVGLETVGKGLELLGETVPKVRRVVVLSNPANPAHTLAIRSLKVTSRSMGMDPQFVEARAPNEFDRAFAAMAQGRAEALVVLADPLFGLHRTRLADLAARSRLPAMYGAREYVEAGGLMSYGPDVLDNFRRSATYVDRILKGVKPADLPIEQPTQFEFVINMKSARALGLTIPQTLLLRADQIIE
jgi:putative ABC transport system substrate-binding protein